MTMREMLGRYTANSYRHFIFKIVYFCGLIYFEFTFQSFYVPRAMFIMPVFFSKSRNRLSALYFNLQAGFLCL